MILETASPSASVTEGLISTELSSFKETEELTATGASLTFVTLIVNVSAYVALPESVTKTINVYDDAVSKSTNA